MKSVLQIKFKCQKIQKLMEMMKVIQVKLNRMKIFSKANLLNKLTDIKNRNKTEIWNLQIIKNFN